MSIINKDIVDIPVNLYPFPYICQDEFLDIDFAQQIQTEIINLPEEAWDRYNNPFEQKYTLRDKYNFPPSLQRLFQELTSDGFVQKLSKLFGYELLLDTTRNFWGVHTYGPGDKLDIHVDAGIHPTLKLKKQLTLGIYLSYEWKDHYGCDLELWKGDNSANNDAKLQEKIISISPLIDIM
jgi:Rps23 Pro-64 3,4-dihydroxylase Tpa1-like proline 4-hydroxylase